MPGSGWLPDAVGQAAQSILKCSLISLLMRLYPLAACEGKEETFMIPAVSGICVFLLSLAAFLNWLLLILYDLDTTTPTNIPSDGNSFWTCNRTLWKPRDFKSYFKEVLFIPFHRCNNEYRKNLLPHHREPFLSTALCMTNTNYTSSPNQYDYQQGQNHTMTEHAIYWRDYLTPSRTRTQKAFKWACSVWFLLPFASTWMTSKVPPLLSITEFFSHACYDKSHIILSVWLCFRREVVPTTSQHVSISPPSSPSGFLSPKYFHHFFGMSLETTAQCSSKTFVFKGTQILWQLSGPSV